MHAMYISINRGKQGATMLHKMKVSILCSHKAPPWDWSTDQMSRRFRLMTSLSSLLLFFLFLVSSPITLYLVPAMAPSLHFLVTKFTFFNVVHVFFVQSVVDRCWLLRNGALRPKYSSTIRNGALRPNYETWSRWSVWIPIHFLNFRIFCINKFHAFFVYPDWGGYVIVLVLILTQ